MLKNSRSYLFFSFICPFLIFHFFLVFVFCVCWFCCVCSAWSTLSFPSRSHSRAVLAVAQRPCGPWILPRPKVWFQHLTWLQTDVTCPTSNPMPVFTVCSLCVHCVCAASLVSMNGSALRYPLVQQSFSHVCGTSLHAECTSVVLVCQFQVISLQHLGRNIKSDQVLGLCSFPSCGPAIPAVPTVALALALIRSLHQEQLDNLVAFDGNGVWRATVRGFERCFNSSTSWRFLLFALFLLRSSSWILIDSRWCILIYPLTWRLPYRAAKCKGIQPRQEVWYRVESRDDL